MLAPEQSTLQIAISYIRRGWRVVRIPLGKKAPNQKGWTSLRITEADAPQHFDRPCNVGVILGEGLVDLDLDCAEAIHFASKIFPAKEASFGRKTKPKSHLLFCVEGEFRSDKFPDPVTGKILVELRGDGGFQTLFPGSLHPSGEPIEWVEDRQPTLIGADELRKKARQIAAYCLIEIYCKGMGITDQASLLKAIENIDFRVADRICVWLGFQSTASAPPRSRSGAAMDLGLGECPAFLKNETNLVPCISDRLTKSMARAYNRAQVLSALAVIPANQRDVWLHVGMAFHESGWEDGFEIWDAWSKTAPEKYNEQDQIKTWKSFDRSSHKGQPVTLATVLYMARERGWRPDNLSSSPSSATSVTPAIRPEQGAKSEAQEPTHPNEGVSLNDFYAYMPTHTYIFTPSRELWPSSSVNSRLGAVPILNPDGTPSLDGKGKPQTMTAHLWLDRNRPVEQMTWAPGLPMLIKDRLISEGGWIERNGVVCFNLYRPPTIIHGNAAAADRWLDHIEKVFGEAAAKHIVMFLAHRVQHPGVKINHALVLGGNQGIGKDTLLEPAKHAVGPWNFSEVSPQHLLGRFNGFLKSVILRVSEARDLGETNRFNFYDHMKAYTAAPPDVLRVDEKNLREYSISNCCGVIITTNHKADGIYLPADDRRHFVAWSELTKEDFAPDYWKILWDWYGRGGYSHVAAYLAELDISSFDPKAPPPKTAAFWDIVDASRAPEEAELADVLDRMGRPDATTLANISKVAQGEFAMWFNDRKNRRVIPHRLERCGYVPVRNDAAKDALWVINGSRQRIYARKDLTLSDQIKAAEMLKLSSSSTTGGRPADKIGIGQ